MSSTIWRIEIFKNVWRSIKSDIETFLMSVNLNMMSDYQNLSSGLNVGNLHVEKSLEFVEIFSII